VGGHHDRRDHPQAAADKAFKRIEEIFAKYQIASG
jgi:hypothetical protein